MGESARPRARARRFPGCAATPAPGHSKWRGRKRCQASDPSLTATPPRGESRAGAATVERGWRGRHVPRAPHLVSDQRPECRPGHCSAVHSAKLPGERPACLPAHREGLAPGPSLVGWRTSAVGRCRTERRIPPDRHDWRRPPDCLLHAGSHREQRALRRGRGRRPAEATRRSGESIPMLKVREIMTPNVYTLAPETTLRNAVSLFTERHVGGAPVVTGGRVVGGAEAEDQVEASPPEPDLLGEHTVSDAMSRRVCRISPDADVSEAADYMKRAGIHRMFVMEGERLVGIVTTMDIARAVAEHKLYVRRFVFERRRARPSA